MYLDDGGFAYETIKAGDGVGTFADWTADARGQVNLSILITPLGERMSSASIRANFVALGIVDETTGSAAPVPLQSTKVLETTLRDGVLRSLGVPTPG